MSNNDTQNNDLDSPQNLIKFIGIIGTSFLAVVVIIIAYFTNLPNFKVEELHTDQIFKYITSSLQITGTIFGGLAVLINAYYASRNAKAAIRNAENTNITAEAAMKNAEAAMKNAKIAEDKQITERFAKAVELLANKEIEARLGGIYTLERIARDSPEDHWTIMEVLTAFIREKRPLNLQDKDKDNQDKDNQDKDNQDKDNQDKDNQDKD
ncbi:MAG TPA: hypothetical protein VK184_27780, partial [Nostocaceae cyanobacterium]|nr:hypothetical protein [Nostocaceae cyanobacterium]